jgi:hypothetical protein
MLICVCLRILASSRIPRYDLGRQISHFLGGSVTAASHRYGAIGDRTLCVGVLYAAGMNFGSHTHYIGAGGGAHYPFD